MVQAIFGLLIFFPILSGIGNYFINKNKTPRREYTAILVSIFECLFLILLFFLKKDYELKWDFLLFHFKADGFRLLYSLITILLWMVTLIFSKEYMAHYKNKDRYYLFYLWTLGAVFGVFLSADLWTTFVFFEMMALTSFVLVLHEENKEAMNAAYTYLVISIVSGMVLLMGIVFIQNELHTLYFEEIHALCNQQISRAVYIGGLCMLVGFGAKAGMFPLHVWLPKAHAVAPAPASALLSGILTKTGIFGIIILCADIFYKQESFGIILLIFALLTMVIGAILAVFSNHLKRTLACSSMSQIGFILVGLSMFILLKDENALAFEGSFLHMVNHSFIKLVLFICAGVVVMNLHQLDLNKIRGFGRNKWCLKICFLIAALGIMGIPFFNGYISKTLLHESIVEAIALNSGSLKVLLEITEWIFLFSGGLTIAYMIKLFVALFVEKNEDEEIQKQYDQQKHYLSLHNKIILCIFAALLVFFGIFPQFSLNPICMFAKDFFFAIHTHFPSYFIFENIKGALISLSVGLVVYFLFIRLLLMKKNENQKRIYIDYPFKWIASLKKGMIYLLKKIYQGFVFLIQQLANLLDSQWMRRLCLIFAYFIKALSEIFDGIIYLIRRYVLRQYKYQFDPHSLSYKVGNFIDQIKHDSTHRRAHDFEETVLTLNDIDLTLASTFSFCLLMACIGLVSILIYLLFIFFHS